MEFSSMIASAIITCSNDLEILPFTISKACAFSNKVSVCYSTHLWNGQPDNYSEVEKCIEKSIRNTNTYNNLDAIIPILFDFEEWMGRTHSLNGIEPKMRQASVDAVADCDHCLLLDGDEVVDPIKFAMWLDNHKDELDSGNYAIRFACHYYFRTASRRAIQNKEEVGLLIPKKRFNEVESVTGCMHIRSGFIKYPEYRTLETLNGEPMFHHYSGVRSKTTVISKTKAWTHRNDFPELDWEKMLTEEYSHDFDGVVPFHNYQTEEVEPYINIGDYSGAEL